tara:strand:- start:682 stop:981 length:300 start_codon:yes stop_codon:yes gene_type:complete
MDSTQMVQYIKQHHNLDLHQDYLDHINTYSKFKLQDVALSTVKSDLPGLDKQKVETYKQLDFNCAPPIVIGDGYIIDGYHRANVAQALNITSITAWVGV